MVKINNNSDEPWYGVKCIFQMDIKARIEGANLYEERIVLIKAASFDEAILKAEKEAEEYTKRDDRITYLGFANAFHIFGNKIKNGSEVYSLIRESKLKPNKYLDKFYDTGTEHTGYVEEQDK